MKEYTMSAKVYAIILSKRGEPPMCKRCRKEIKVNDPVVVMRFGARGSKWYHKDCWEELFIVS